MERIISYCGIICSECNAYLATKNNDQALREKIAAEWAKEHNFNCTPDMINCTSCKSDGVKVGYCYQCEIRKCAGEKNVVNCGACVEFKTCKTINGFLTKVPSLRENLTEG